MGLLAIYPETQEYVYRGIIDVLGGREPVSCAIQREIHFSYTLATDFRRFRCISYCASMLSGGPSSLSYVIIFVRPHLNFSCIDPHDSRCVWHPSSCTKRYRLRNPTS